MRSQVYKRKGLEFQMSGTPQDMSHDDYFLSPEPDYQCLQVSEALSLPPQYVC
jgi:hypothetical protein